MTTTIQDVMQLAKDPGAINRLLMGQAMQKYPRLRVLDENNPAHAGWAPTLAMLMGVEEQMRLVMEKRGPIAMPGSDGPVRDDLSEAREHVEVAIKHLLWSLGIPG